MLTDYVFGSAIDALGWSAERLWHSLRGRAAPAAAQRAVSQRGDVGAGGAHRAVAHHRATAPGDEFPERLEDLVTSARQKTPSVIHAPLSAPLREWLLRALQLQPKSFATLFDAQMALERLLAAEPSLLAQPTELETAVARFARLSMAEFELPVVPNLPLLEAPPPGQVPLAVALNRAPAQRMVAVAAQPISGGSVHAAAAQPVGRAPGKRRSWAWRSRRSWASR